MTSIESLRSRLSEGLSNDRANPLDVPSRLDEFRILKHGWMDGEGQASSRRGLDWLAAAFARHYLNDIPLPYTYPTPAGGVQLEWSLGSQEISLEIDLENRRARWRRLDMTSDADDEKDLDLDRAAGWQWLAAEINRWGGASIMTDDTLLYRQIHPQFVQRNPQTGAERATSQAFRPTSDGKISTYDGDQITVADSWTHYTQNPAPPILWRYGSCDSGMPAYWAARDSGRRTLPGTQINRLPEVAFPSD